MPPNERQRRLELEREVDEIKAQVLVMWGNLRRISDQLGELRDDENERQSQTAIDRYREELPSETKISLSPTGVRATTKNGRPLRLVLVLVVGVIVLAWLLRPR